MEEICPPSSFSSEFFASIFLVWKFLADLFLAIGISSMRRPVSLLSYASGHSSHIVCREFATLSFIWAGGLFFFHAGNAPPVRSKYARVYSDFICFQLYARVYSDFSFMSDRSSPLSIILRWTISSTSPPTGRCACPRTP